MQLKRPRFIVLAALVVAGGFVLGYFWTSNDDETLEALRREAALLESQLAIRVPLIARPDMGSEPSTPGLAATSVPPDLRELEAHLEQLAEAVARLEEVARNLEQRITRSQLALFSFETIKARMVPMREELDRGRKGVFDTYSAAAGIAKELNVKLTIDLTDPNQITPPPLAGNPRFVAARNKFLFSQRLLNAFENIYQTTLFSAKLTKSTDPAKYEKSLPPLPTSSPLGGDPDDPTFPLDRLSVAIARLEIVVRDLEHRITRAQRVLPTKEENRAKLPQMRNEVDRGRRGLRAKVEDAIRIADQFNVKITEDQLIDDAAPLPPTLDNPRFLAARAKAILERRVLEQTQQIYQGFISESK